MSFDSGESPFEILGVDETADETAIRTAYHERIKQVHPDTNRGNGSEAATDIAKLQQARDALLDPDTRDVWLERLRSQRLATMSVSDHALVVYSNDLVAPVPPPAPAAYPFWGWLDVLLFGVVLVACLVGAAIATVAVNFAIVAAGASQYAFSLAQSAVVMQALGFGPALFLLSRMLRARYGRGLREAVQLAPVERIGLYAGAGLATALMVAILSAVFKLQEMEMPMNEFIRTDADLILVGIAAFTFGPLFEEMMFRGFLQPLVTKSLGAPVGIFLCALLFALPHGPQYGWHWQLIVIITAAGSVFGYIRWKAASTTAATIAHSAYNGLLLMGAVIQRFREIG